jgi:hypothetical protein
LVSHCDLFGRIHGKAVLPGAALVDELDLDIGTDSFDPAISPLLERIGRRRAVIPAGRVGFDLIWRAEHDVNVPAIALPAGNAGRIALIRVRDTAVVFFLVFVLGGIRRRIATQPELFDKLLALVVGSEPVPCLPLLIGEDVGDILVQPLLVRRLRNQTQRQGGEPPAYVFSSTLPTLRFVSDGGSGNRVSE